MIINRNIIVFSDDWGRYPSTLQHIGKILAKYNKIIWVGSLGLRKPRLNKSDLKRIIEKLKSIFFKKKNISISQVIELSPFIIPFHDSKFIRKLNSFLLIIQLKKVVARNRITKPIVLTSSAIMESIAGKLGETSIHYFCLDDFTLFDGAFKSINKLEKSLLEKVDICFAISETLKQSRIPAKGRSYFLPQGVEVEHFTKLISKSSDMLQSTPRPIIGFFGLLAPWIDLDLVKSCAEHYPDFSFVLIGRSEVDLESLRVYKNIYFLGEVPYSQLPEYAKEFDVGIIPFKVNKLTTAANPLKLLEYFSIGLPVVSTDLPEVRKFQDLVLIAENSNEFIEFIKVAVNEKVIESKTLERKAIAKKYSWTTIAEMVSTTILEVDKFQS